MSLNLPLIAYGTVEDISGALWTALGSPTVTTGVSDPFGGTGAVTINDTDSGSAQGRYRGFTVSVNGTNWVGFFVQAGTAAQSTVGWYDVTAAAYLARVSLTWSGGVPTAAVYAGSGSVLPPVSLGRGWYFILMSANAVVAANSQRLYVRPAGDTSASTGSATFYWQSAVLLDFPDQPVAWAENREGSARARAPSGAYDSWITGTDYRFRALCPWIPSAPRSAPAIVSGWSGLAPIPGVDCGVAAMLAAGRNATSLRWVPDRSVCTTYIDSELVAPFDPAPPDLGPDGTRRITLELRNITTPYPLYDG